MKSILRFGMALAVVAMACPVWASVPGDNIFFSSSASNPNAGTTLTFNAAAQPMVLYIWASQGGNTTDATNDAITPIVTTYTNNTPNGAAAIAISGALSASPNVNITGVRFYNPALTGTNAGLNRWSAVSNSAAGYTNWNASSFTNLEANATLPVNQPSFAGKTVGLSTANTGGIDPQYFATNPPNSTTGAWLLGEVDLTNNTTTNSTSTLTLSAGSLGLTKSQTAGTVDLTSNYSFGSATLTVLAQVLGDDNGDGKVDLADLNGVINNFGTNNPGGDAAHDGNPTGLSDLNAVINNFGFGTGAGGFASVPEPASLGLLALGSLAAIGYSTRRRKAA